MRRFFVLILIAILLITAGGLYIVYNNKSRLTPNLPIPSKSPNSAATPAVTSVAENLDTPWGIVFLPDNSILVTERKGTIQRINGGQKTQIAQISNAKEIGEGGLLGITLDPDFSSNNFVYLYYTYNADGDNTLNRVVRMTYQNNKLSNEKILVDAIPGASNHNGGRIKFGPDNFLYIATGDAQEPSLAQDTKTLAGKILRVTTDGKAALGNPFNNLVYSYGHRNVQGLSWDEQGNLWTTEHGRSGIQSGLDEINLIESGKNYGWPDIEGDKTQNGMETAKRNSGDITWAPAGAAFVGDSLFFAGLRGQALYEAVIKSNEVTEVKEHFKNEFGRIREVALGPDGLLYITTSNLDGRGTPASGDDKIIRINPRQ